MGHGPEPSHLSGLETVAAIAKADLSELTRILRRAVPFESKDTQEGSIGNIKRNWLANHGKMMENEAVELIKSRGKEILKANLLSLGVEIKESEKEQAASSQFEETFVTCRQNSENNTEEISKVLERNTEENKENSDKGYPEEDVIKSSQGQEEDRQQLLKEVFLAPPT